MKLKIKNPATDEFIEEVAEDTKASIQEKFSRAKIAQKKWAKASLSDRLKPLSRFKDLLIENTEDLAKTLSSEMGKPIQQARNELKAMPERIDFYLKETASVLEDSVMNEKSSSTHERISYEPLGVVANISAWNYPYFVSANVFLPALLTGNAVMFKPSEFATLSGIKMTALLHEAGIPEDVFVPVIGDHKAGSLLLDCDLNAVFFTGSYATGKKIAEHIAPKLIKLQLELGGKDPVYVCGDMDPKAAAENLAEGAFYNAGQSCCAVERLYIERPIADEFIEHFVNSIKQMKVGDPLDEKTDLGPLARKPQIKVLEAQIKDAVDKGAKLYCGGKAMTGAGYYFEPSVLSNVDHSMSIMTEESFGPVIGIQVVENDEEATKLMNDTTYGLTAAVFTKDQDRAKKILSEINSGTVYWNCCDRVSPMLPWSGRKHSGLGLTSSIDGIRAFLQPKAWHLRAN
jgi:acyl-CoA reductase-like NAD-dependent aldehyde dehydrogenase